MQCFGHGVDRTAGILYSSSVQLLTWAQRCQPWRMLMIDRNPVHLIDIGKIVSADDDMHNQSNSLLSLTEIPELHNMSQLFEEEVTNAVDKRHTSITPNGACKPLK